MRAHDSPTPGPSPEGEGRRPSLRRWATRPRRRADWEDRLNAWLERALAVPHGFGGEDCVMKALGAVEAQTGRDIAEGHRGKYRTRAGAARYLRALGFKSAAELLDTQLDPVAPAFARRGDLVLALGGDPGVCIGADAIFFLEEGNLRLPRSEWTQAWRAAADEGSEE